MGNRGATAHTTSPDCETFCLLFSQKASGSMHRNLTHTVGKNNQKSRLCFQDDRGSRSGKADGVTAMTALGEPCTGSVLLQTTHPARMRTLLLATIRAYQRWISPLLGSNCRFYPTCSQYAAEAIERYGVWKGTWLAVRRLLRCHRWHPGGIDPVP